ncbi:MAG: epoxyqueuosine reductase QueH [Clostridia bacterium]|nr:epoxyqueuosine reductase QueH [Clostridia bacterium]
MNKPDFDKIMQKQIEELCGRKASLLLHSCCAPCSSACLERLKDFFQITVFYYNPNIEDGEYEVRKAEQIRLLQQTNWAGFLDCEHDGKAFSSAICGLESEKEGGKRCEVCYRLRIEKTAQTAKELGFEFFATTLTVSPLKNSAKINAIGKDIEKQTGVKWLHNDFKKRGGYLESIKLSQEYNLYRQNYCGCVYSKRPEQ